MPDAIDGRVRLKKYAKANGARFTEQVLLDINVPEPLLAKVVVRRGGLSLDVRASQSFFVLTSKARPRVVFSIGQPDQILRTDQLLTQPRFQGVQVFVRAGRENALEREWLRDAANRALLIEAGLQHSEAIHVVENCIIYVLSSRRDLDESISHISQLTRILTSAEKVSEPHLDLSPLPSDLAALVQRFERFAVSDDELREEVTRDMAIREQDHLIADVAPLLPRINSYLDTLPPTWPEAASRLSDLAQLTAELMVSRQPPDAGRRVRSRSRRAH